MHCPRKIDCLVISYIFSFQLHAIIVIHTCTYICSCQQKNPSVSTLMYMYRVHTCMYVCMCSLQAISSVGYGGALATTVEHSTPYVLDTSPPVLTDMIITEYDVMSAVLIFSYNARYVYFTTRFAT